MPKTKKKQKPGAPITNGAASLPLSLPDRKRLVDGDYDDGYSTIDNQSLTSSTSELRSVCDEGCVPGQDTNNAEEEADQDALEERLKEDIDGCIQKSAKARLQCLESILKTFASKSLFDFVYDWRETILDALEKCLKKGKPEEQGPAAMAFASLCIQLGAGPETEQALAEIKPVLLTIATDNTKPIQTRAKCCCSLGIASFIVERDMDLVAPVMEVLESLFTRAYSNGHTDKNVAPLNGNAPQLHCAALAAWSLLLTVCAASRVWSLVDKHLYRLPDLLESPDVDLRITAGETIALFYEIVREFDDEFDSSMDDSVMDDLCEKLKQLATDSQKFRAKKERKQQRSNFRDILKGVEEREPPNIQLKFGREVLLLDSWCKKRQYDAFCQILGSGMNLHLTENYLLRDIFELGPPVSTDEGNNQRKISKFERHLTNVANFKARTQARSKCRDKRNAFLC